MIIKQVSGLGADALAHPGKYNGFMAISLRNKYYSKENVMQYIEWGAQLFGEFIILLMDYPDRYNLMVFKETSEEEAVQKVQYIAQYTKEAYEKIIKQLKVENVKVHGYFDYLHDPTYKEFSRKSQESLLSEQTITTSLHALLYENIGYRIESFAIEQKLSQEDVLNMKSMLTHYITEELSLMIFLTQNGYPIEVEPYKELGAQHEPQGSHWSTIYHKLKVSDHGHIFAKLEQAVYGKRDHTN